MWDLRNGDCEPAIQLLQEFRSWPGSQVIQHLEMPTIVRTFQQSGTILGTGELWRVAKTDGSVEIIGPGPKKRPWIQCAGWWLTYPSEKYEFVNGKDDNPYMKWKFQMFQTTNQMCHSASLPPQHRNTSTDIQLAALFCCKLFKAWKDSSFLSINTYKYPTNKR